MRRTTPPLAVALAATTVAVAWAATSTHTTTVQFNQGTATNVNTGGDELKVATLESIEGLWNRSFYDGTDFWQFELAKTAVGSPAVWVEDTCLPTATNDYSAVERDVFATHPFRTGPLAINGNEAAVESGRVLAMPGGNRVVSHVKFVTHGSRHAQTSYTITIDRQGAGDLTVTVPIPTADVVGAARNGSGTSGGVNWTRTGLTGVFTGDVAGDADCLGNGGDVVVLTLPASSNVVDIDIAYPSKPAAPGTDPWLGGPLSISLETNSTAYDAAYTWKGTYISSATVATAVSSTPTRGQNGIWYRIDWTQSNFVGNSEVELYFRCGADTSGNGTIAGTEWKAFDGGPVNAWQGPHVLDGSTTSWNIDDCSGPYAQYRLEYLPEFDISPVLEELRFIYNPDVDGDGFPAESVAGMPQQDCNDNNAALNHLNVDGDGFSTCQGDCNDNNNQIFPGRTLLATHVNDGVDQDCNGTDECYTNVDQDPVGGSAIVNDLPAGGCLATNSRSLVTGDCADNDATRYPGKVIAQIDIANGVDNNCSGADECWFDDDRDGQGASAGVVVAATAPGSCVTSNRQSTNRNDCDDTRNDVFLGKTIVQADIANGRDNDCNGHDECWFDGDRDGFGVPTVEDDTEGDGCVTVQFESTTSNDCDDTSNQIYPNKPIVQGDIANGVDNDCDGQGRDECWRDQDQDGQGGSPGVVRQSASLGTCVAANQESNNTNDCNDNNNQVFQGKTIVLADIGNGVDNNCNGFDECYRDQDRDTYGTSTIVNTALAAGCQTANQQALVAGDCDDTRDDVYPNKVITQGDIANNRDNDCDGTGRDECWLDDDRDGFGASPGTVRQAQTMGACTTPNRESTNATDCNDANNQAFPGKVIVQADIGNGIDNNCNGADECWRNDDGDGFGVSTVINAINGGCAPGDGRALVAGDCNDGVATINPGMNDACTGPNPFGGNGIDNDCSGNTVFDDDGDGLQWHLEDAFGTNDCLVDTDSDGLNDLTEYNYDCNTNVAGVQRLNGTNPDTDGDGINDGAEPDADTDGNGIRNRCDNDDDGDGIPTTLERPGGVNIDTDGDGIPNHLDNDDDGDGIPTSAERPGGVNRDSDGDGIPDHLDNDDDNDGILTINERPGGANVDTDGDTTPDHLDNDDDNDGIPTATERVAGNGPLIPCSAGSTQTCRDQDGNGTPNHRDLDSDNDGFTDNFEWNYLPAGFSVPGCSTCNRRDFDGDGRDDYVDTDSDNDGVIDERECGGRITGLGGFCALAVQPPTGTARDSDGDGFENRVDADDDNDGLPTTGSTSPTAEGTADLDSDTIPNYLDTDDDGDGILTSAERPSGNNVDTDGNGVPNHFDNDDDGDGVPTSQERPGGVNRDTDGDGTPDHLDNDDDNDGILTINERPGGVSVDTDSNTVPDFLDNDDDGDGIPTATERVAGNGPQIPCSTGSTQTCRDQDGNGTPNHRDLDSDNDGFTDNAEWNYLPAGFSVPGCSTCNRRNFDGDGLDDYVDTDSDNDGVLDERECGGRVTGLGGFCALAVQAPTGTTRDSDGDGFENRVDTDDDNDGLPTTGSTSPTAEGTADLDTDTIPNYLDLDDDGDGIPTPAERPSGNNVDTDGDGAPNHFDADDDGDGVPTIQERPSGANRDTDTNGTPDHLDNDDDGDGILTINERPGGVSVDTDSNTVPDFLDDDDDGDGIPTATERVAGNGPQIPCSTGSTQTCRDQDGNGTPNHRDLDSDNDGFTDNFEWNYLPATFSVPGCSACNRRDFDGDGRQDFVDTDSDNDSVLDELECGGRITGVGGFCALAVSAPPDVPNPIGTPRNTDGDGFENRVDIDDDNDTIPTSSEGTGDPDNDTIPNYLDRDSDGDGWSDRVEWELSPGGTRDTDGDGTRDFLDTDSDNDDVLDIDERNADTDSDGTPNRLDNDDDGDGIPTRLEHADGQAPGPGRPTNADFDSDTTPNYLDTDSDNDGWLDSLEWSQALNTTTRDSEGDGQRDFLDLDSDNDNVLDSRECGGAEEGTSARCVAAGTNPIDTDGNGVSNRLDPDDDGDSIPTRWEEPVVANNDPRDDDSDNDTLPNYLDRDDDNDGVLTLNERNAGTGAAIACMTGSPETCRDQDGDGIANFLDTDDDDDGILTRNEDVNGNGSAWDDNTDGDALRNFLDADDDNDGILTSIEYVDGNTSSPSMPCATGSTQTCRNQDGDAQPNHLDLDSDNDGWTDAHEWTTVFTAVNRRDYDQDGLNDYLDTDSDNDTVLDRGECGGPDAPGQSCTAAVAGGPSGSTPTNTDGDARENRIDEDDDGDNHLTAEERYPCSAGAPQGCLASTNTNATPRDFDYDNDNIANFLDRDDDGDNVPTLAEDIDANGDSRNDDSDGDGLANFLDIDDDNDGLLTRNEIDCGSSSPNDPRLSDTDNDSAGCNVGVDLNCGPNYLDTDDDDDTIPTSIELGYPNADSDGCQNAYDLDSDDDGFSDEHEWNYLPLSFARDFDGDGTPDFVDLDSDNDNVPDRFECGGAVAPTSVCVAAGADAIDTNGDGMENRVDIDDDGDSIPTVLEEYACDGGTGEDPTSWGCVGTLNNSPRQDDWDGDGIANYLDMDDDDDNVATLAERGAGTGDPVFCSPPTTGELCLDQDGDGAPNFLDKDDDDDSVPTIFEDWQSPGDPFNTNTDAPDPSNPWDVYAAFGDDLPDFLDLDDDGDTIPTILEDANGDGDPRNDNYDLSIGLPPCTLTTTPSSVEEIGLTVACSDDLADYLDYDDDGDGVPTWAELVNEPGSTYHRNPDSDGDGIADGREWVNFLDITAIGPAGASAAERAELWADAAPCGDPSNLDSAGLPLSTGKRWDNPWDRDCDGLINALDTDDDGDGIPTDPTSNEFEADEDCLPGTGIPRGDGIPNWLDDDSDGHTMTVAPGSHPNCPPTSTGPCELRTDGDETDYFDSDGDTIPDAYDCDDSGPDGDSDLDGISNALEIAMCTPARLAACGLPPGLVFADETGCAKMPDSDCDGVLDCIEAGVPCPGDAGWVPGSHVTQMSQLNLQNTNGGPQPNIYDPDDDGDTILTSEELGFTCPTGATLGPADLQPWPLENPEGWRYVCPNGTFLQPHTQNTDAPGAFSAPFPLNPDNVPDYLDDNDDGDNRPTAVEGRADDDGDGVVNYLDPNDFDGGDADPDMDGLTNAEEVALGLSPYNDDSDSDGVPDRIEIGPDTSNPRDTDGDGIIDALDVDDDGDGLLTRDEGVSDVDGDGTPNYLDLDSDGDGQPDAEENPGGDARIDVDCDGVPNFLDPNDNDGPCATGNDSGDLDDQVGCNCDQSGGFGASWLALLALAVLRRRRG